MWLGVSVYESLCVYEKSGRFTDKAFYCILLVADNFTIIPRCTNPHVTLCAETRKKMSEAQEQLPEWMLRLENKRKKQHRLAHEIGAGAPCFVCQNSCPGLDLHFWRKLCRNCKCKKEDHDVKDDEGYEQFDILLGSTSDRKRKGGFLKLKVADSAQSPVVSKNHSSKGISFDWLPPNVSEEVAAKYMQQLPAAKLPISGSDGALYRRQQLTKQVPLHDLDAKHCHNLTADEIEQLMKYLENLKSNVVGQGCVGMISSLYTESRSPSSESSHLIPPNDPAGRLLTSSQSADPIRPLPPMPPVYNSVPRPFHASSSSSAYGSGEDDDLPPPLPTSLPPRRDLKTPSEFLPEWHLPEDCAVPFGRIVDGMRDLHLQQQDIPSYHIKDTLFKETALSHECLSQKPQLSNSLPSQKVSLSIDGKVLGTQAVPLESESKLEELKLEGGTETGGTAGLANCRQSAAQSGNVVLRAQHVGHVQNILDPKYEMQSGAQVATSTAVNALGPHCNCTTLPAHSATLAVSFPKDTIHSSVVLQHGGPLSSRPLVGHESRLLPVSVAETLILSPNEAISENVEGTRAFARAVGGGEEEEEEEEEEGVNVCDVSALNLRQFSVGEHLHSLNTDNLDKKDSQVPCAIVKYSTPAENEGGMVLPVPVDGVVMSNIFPHSVIQSSAVGTDTLPKSAEVMQLASATMDPVLAAAAAAAAGSAGPVPAKSPGGTVPHLDCHECGLHLLAGHVAVFAERAGTAAWHPSCFVCFTCKELLVDLMYFYYKDNVYCGRHFAELLGIPRCFACDELIFVKEYTVAEGKVFHVKHFCCYECDDPLAGKQYIPVDDQPMCLDCYEHKYGKQCHCCQRKIAAGEQRVGWKHLNWHVQGNCFRCFECAKTLLGGRFVVKENQPFCSKECVQAGLQKMAGAA